MIGSIFTLIGRKWVSLVKPSQLRFDVPTYSNSEFTANLSRSRSRNVRSDHHGISAPPPQAGDGVPSLLHRHSERTNLVASRKLLRYVLHVSVRFKLSPLDVSESAP
jgi:hypothetical protein